MIQYRSKYKHQLVEGYVITLPQLQGIAKYDEKYLCLRFTGTLYIRSGYAWDGASGPLVDTKQNMRGSLVHDALYQLIRVGAIPESYRDVCDKIFRDICIEDGVVAWRAYLWYYGLKVGGGLAASPENKRITRIAP